MTSTKKTIDIIIPCHNEEGNISAIVNSIDMHMDNSKFKKRFIFVDDGSTDGTCQEINCLEKCRDDVCLIRLSRNFGKEAAIAAGLRQCVSDAAIVIDGDLQHPPHLIPNMIAEWERGVEIIDAVKVRRDNESLMRKIPSSLFNKIYSKLIGIDFDGASDFKLLDRKAIEILNSISEKERFFRGLTNWIGMSHSKIEFQVEQRNSGTTKWNTFKLFRLSIDAIVSYSQRPLQIVSILGIFTLLFSLVLGIQTLYQWVIGYSVSGFTTVIILILMMSSIIMISMGIIGLYISKIYDEVKGRPVFVVDDRTDEIKSENMIITKKAQII